MSNSVLGAMFAAIIVFGFLAAGVLLTTWILSTLLPLFGVTATVTWLHGLAVFLLIGLLGTRGSRK